MGDRVPPRSRATVPVPVVVVPVLVVPVVVVPVVPVGAVVVWVDGGAWYDDPGPLELRGV